MNDSVSKVKHSSGFATASLVLGIIGLATGCCIYTSIICGALAVIFALLSRGGEMTMPGKSKIGLGLGIASTVMGILILAIAFAYMILQFGGLEGYLDYYNDLMQQLESGYPYTL